MKKIVLAISTVVLVLGLAGCATTTTSTGGSTSTSVTTPDVTKVCSGAQAALTVISTVATAYDATTAQNLSDASTVVADLCTAGTTVDATTLAKVASTTIPALITLVRNLDIDATTKATVLAGLATAQLVINAANAVLASSTTTSLPAKMVLSKWAPQVNKLQIDADVQK